jgi:mono/diheme cytochrome c family protein
VRGIVLGIFLAMFIVVAGGYLLVRSGRLSMATSAPPLPMEMKLAHMAIRASIGDAKDKKDPLPFDDANMVAGVKVYKQHCALCHGSPQQAQPAMAKAMYPPPPQLFESKDMVTDDPDGETYWKVVHGIRLTGMPGFADILTDTQCWQVTMLVAHADKLSHAAQMAFEH